MTYVDPATLAPQGPGQHDAAERRAVKLWLVIQDEMPTRRYAVDADSAWTYRNDAYDHCGGAFESPGPNAGCWYERRSVAASPGARWIKA